MGLGSLPVGCLAWGNPTLEPTWALWWGQWWALGGLTPRSTSQNFCCQCPCPHGETQPPPASAGDPPTLAGRSGSVSPGVTAPSPVSRCAHYFMCALQEWSLCSPQSSRSPAIKSHWPSKSDSLWEFLLPLPDPHVGEPDVGPRTLTPVGGPLCYKCSPVCEPPTQQSWDSILLQFRPSHHLTEAPPPSLDVGHPSWWAPVSSHQWLSSS